MNLYEHFRVSVLKALRVLADQGVLPEGLATDAIAIDTPREQGRGELACNAALVLAKQARMKPRDIAEFLASALRTDDDIATVEIAGPGFLNLTLKPGFWQARIQDVLREGRRYGWAEAGSGDPVNVEYVSANPTGPLHIGHARGAVFGDALASLLAAAGAKVTREYYINDAGGQLVALARSAHWRYREAQGDVSGPMPSDLYPGDYLKPVGEELAEKFGRRLLAMPEIEDNSDPAMPRGGWRELCADLACARMMETIRGDLESLGIRHDVFTSEQALHRSGKVDEAVRALEARDLVYVGTLEPPKGQLPEDWEPRPQTLFRATRFGDDVDRPLRKSDGSWTYFASDIAYHWDKVQRGFSEMIDVWGADHSGYVKRVEAAVAAMTQGSAHLDVKICQIVRLLEAGEPIKMSKRADTFVTVRELVEEVGRDAVRFIMLTRRNDAQLDFDIAKVREQSKDNPVFYVQYAHARCRSVFRLAGENFPDLESGDLVRADLGGLSAPEELEVIRQVASWPRTLDGAAQAHEPHRVAFYLYDLANAFHILWNRGRDEPTLRFLTDDRNLSQARLALVRAVEIVLAAGLGLLGVTAPEEMR